MPGEKLASITIQAFLSHNAAVRGTQTDLLRFKFGGRTFELRRGGNPDQFVVPDSSPAPYGAGEKYVLRCVENVLAQLRNRITAPGSILPYAFSALREVGTMPDTDTNPTRPIVEFDITAQAYGYDLELDFESVFLGGNYGGAPIPRVDGWAVTKRVANVSPVFCTAAVTDATAYGAADGSIILTPSGGTTVGPLAGYYDCVWSDGTTGAVRNNLTAGRYTCTVFDPTSGAYVVVVCDVHSDARLDVQVQQVANNVTLVISGGLAPYTIQWADGPTTDTRTKLAPGTYPCTVTDARGVQVTVTVQVLTYNVFYFSRNPVTLSLQASNLATKPNLRFVCEVWLEPEYGSGQFINIAGVLTQPADTQGRTTFDVSTLLDAYVQPDFPAHGDAALALARPTFKRFYLQHSEQWDGSGAPTYTVRATHYLVYGGLDFFEYAAGKYFDVYRPKVHPFLTWEPAQKEVFPDQPEYLYYHHDSLTEDYFGVQVKFTTSGGATTTALLGTATGVQCFEVWRVGVGLPQLKTLLPGLVPADVVAWEVAAVDAQGQPITETRYYQLSDELPAARRYFLYANSIGGINTLATQGKAKREADYTNVLVQRTLLPGYSADAGDTYTPGVTAAPFLTVNTGHLNPPQMAALEDFLLSEEIRYFDTDRYRPGTLQPGTTVPLEDDDTGLISLDFVFLLPTQRRYTPTLPKHF